MDLATQRLMMAAAGAVGGATYVDDVFSTYLYKGNGGANQIVNGINNTDESMVWLKTRYDADYAVIFDTIRGGQQWLIPSENFAAGTDAGQHINTFNNNGFTLQSNASGSNASTSNYASWNFKSAPGFFDVVTYTGTGSARTVAHSLESVPGMVIIKKTSGAENWNVWHKSLPLRDGYDYTRQKLELNTGTPAANLGGNTTWNDTKPSATTITLGTNSEVNENNATYVAYFFAGGESTTNKAVDFDGSGDYLSLPSTTDLNLTGDFTIEFWVYPRSQSTSRQTILQTNRSFGAKYAVLQIQNDTQSGLSKKAQLWDYDMNSGYAIAYSNADIEEDEWTHIAFTRESGTIKIWINGKLDKTTTSLNDSIEFGDTSSFIGNHSNSYYLNAKLSNLRIVKGQALYTNNFNVPQDPLTTTSQGAVATNVKLLCCNGTTAAASTVTPVTITANGDPTVTSNNSIFDDTSANVFGDAGDQNVIKCGSYTGNGNDDGPEINLGWEPQWILFRNIEENGDEWVMYDAMRGLVTNGNDARLYANHVSVESSVDQVDLTSTGFKITTSHSQVNRVDNQLIYVAIRRPDGYCGKPPELGTDVFAMDTGNSSSTEAFTSNFPVDFALERQPTPASTWETCARLIQAKYLVTNSNGAEGSGSYFTFDSNTGWMSNNGYNSTFQSWMWKRGAGFDVVTYTGNGVGGGRQIPHSLNKAPEMMWFKNRDSDPDWNVYHKGLNGGTNPEQKYLVLNSTAAEADNVNRWNDTATTSTVFTIGDSGRVNTNTHNYIAMLFASVDGISKVGYYTGTGSTTTITTGFQPRFVIIKRTDSSSNWWVLDTVRGWGSGDDEYLQLNKTNAQGSLDFGAPTSTGFTLAGGNSGYNGSSANYIYYAHS